MDTSSTNLKQFHESAVKRHHWEGKLLTVRCVGHKRMCWGIPTKSGDIKNSNVVGGGGEGKSFIDSSNNVIKQTEVESLSQGITSITGLVWFKRYTVCMEKRWEQDDYYWRIAGNSPHQISQAIDRENTMGRCHVSLKEITNVICINQKKNKESISLYCDGMFLTWWWCRLPHPLWWSWPERSMIVSAPPLQYRADLPHPPGSSGTQGTQGFHLEDGKKTASTKHGSLHT